MRRRNHGRDRPRPPWPTLYPEAYDDVVAALRDHPLLRLVEEDGRLAVKGRVQIRAEGNVLDTFAIRILFPRNYPKDLPILFIVGDRIPVTPERHVNNDCSACLYVQEEWLARRSDAAFATFLNTPVRNFFLGQLYYEEHGRFPPTGERAHYGAGLIDAYADILGVSPDFKRIHYWLCLLATNRSKGHWICPCGSGKIIRRCCRAEVHAKRNEIPVALAKRMKRQIEREIELRSARQKR